MLVHHLPGGRVESLAFGPDGRTLIAPRPGAGLHVWADIAAGTPPRVFPRSFLAPDGTKQFDDPSGPVRVSADGRRVGCRGWFRPVVYDLAGGPPAVFPPEVANCEYHAALAPAGDAVVLSQSTRRHDARGQLDGYDGRLSLRPVADPRPAADRWAVGLDRLISAAADFPPGGSTFVTAETGVTPARWEFWWVVRDLGTGAEVRSVRLPTHGAPPPVAAPDGRWVAGVLNSHLVAWRAHGAAAPVVARRNAGRLHFTGLAFHPSGAVAATTSTDATVRLYDTSTWEVVRTYAWEIGKLRCVAFSPDGLLAAAGSESGNIVVWDVDL